MTGLAWIMIGIFVLGVMTGIVLKGLMHAASMDSREREIEELRKEKKNLLEYDVEVPEWDDFVIQDCEDYENESI